MSTVFVPLHLNNYGGNATPYALDGRLGSVSMPMFTHIAAPLGRHSTEYGTPNATTDGVVCGACTESWADAGIGPVRHAGVDQVRECFEADRRIRDEHEAEWPLVRAGWL